ncbi:RNA polymerase sigma factor [Candidatus Poribacteria bacterium]
MRSEDGNIICECLNGETEAFGMLVDKYKEGIYAFVYGKLRDFQSAQDVTQEVFLQAYRDLRSLRRWESFVFWLYRIASTRCKMWARSQSRRVDQDFIEDQAAKAIDIPSLDSYRKDQMSKSLREAVDSLPEIYREVLMLYYFGGMSIKDIARAVGVSPTAIGKRLSRARSQLKEEMVTMTDTVFEGQRLPAGFTFRIVEAAKHIKINPMPRTAGVPWGLS